MQISKPTHSIYGPERIQDALREVMNAHPDRVRQADTDPRLLGWFIGQVMRSLNGVANPHLVSHVVATTIGPAIDKDPS
jgi:aspartyl-tRNA(Asn)/glutamyl-tRNA(Gln) amidotransferase subunit B